MITSLQSESAEVFKARKVLQSLKDSAEESVPSLQTGNARKDNFEVELQSNSEVIRNAILYVNKNREAIDEVTLGHLNEKLAQKVQNGNTPVDPIESLMALSRSELAYAYDALLSCLEQREKEIEHRIKSQINYLGKEERILFEHKDWKRENEDMN
jgi:Arc/MetJ-type ribon-helix-helix transcriptional regulator